MFQNINYMQVFWATLLLLCVFTMSYAFVIAVAGDTCPKYMEWDSSLNQCVYRTSLPPRV